jgi:hypothetical protein
MRFESQWAGLLIVFAITGLVASTLLAQEAPQLPLRPKEAVPIAGLYSGAIMGTAKCDASGNLYVRLYDLSSDGLASPVLKISSDGKSVSRFDIRSVSGFESAEVDDFAVDPRGNVYLLRSKPGEPVALVVFNPGGSYDSIVKLDSQFEAIQLAIFSSGEYLVSGTKEDEECQNSDEKEKNSELADKPFTGVFDRVGRLILEVTLPKDIQNQKEGHDPPSAAVNKSESAKPTQSQSSDFRQAMVLGRAVSTRDGNIYLMRASRRPIIYIISPAGSVLRRLEIGPPSQDAVASDLHVAAGKLAVKFAERDPAGRYRKHSVVLVNAESGETLALYPVTPAIGGALACYTGDRFAFFGANEQGQLVIRYASPQ